MNFNEKIKTSFIKAGWYPNRNVKNRYSKVKGINKLPEKIKEFLFEYGDLVLEPYQNLYSDEYDFSVRLLKNKKILFSE
ncbi:hypothetical protein JJC03_07360 [Flavobacterium oreochromis]|uniref:hypothetical protein n=1 Tax=Flavobacterium oreochromis TaxID=2906078 RepID=UPI001CE6EF4A|nr:hypothetical protein [Flavobacterium oreochromis]QYS87620.1 hypothetical protein JJC03_07360 [Flavobacterium oreochromis]